MQIEILTGIIAGGVGLTAGALSFLASFFKNRADIQSLRRTLEESYMRSIFEKRIAAYSKAWLITGKFSSLVLKPPSPIPANEIKATMEKLHDWYNSEGGFVLSKESRSRYFELRKMCWNIEEGGALEGVRRSTLYEQIWLRKMDFRNSLRKDVFLEDKLVKHSREEWHFD
jgi:hypothetical protein